MAAGAALALAVGIQAPGLSAQEQAPPPQQPQQQQAPDVSVSDAEMEQFVDAYLEVEQIQLALNEEMQSAEDAQTAQQAQEQANQEMATAISEKGMDVERFSMIVQAINADPELQQEFVAKRMELVDEQ